MLRPKKFDDAKVCSNCGIEFMPDPEDRIYCKGCDPQNSGTPIKINIPKDKDLIMEGKTEKHERQIADLEKRVKKLEDIFNSIEIPKSEETIIGPNLNKEKIDIKGHYPKVCKRCGEAFVAEWPSRTICDECKEKGN